MSKLKIRRKNNDKSRVVSNVMSLDPKNPIPYEPTGNSKAFIFDFKSKGYIPFLAPKDNFFQLLLEAKLLSPTNNSCVNSKTYFCIGKGLYFKDEKEKDQDFIKWAKRVNKKGQKLNKILSTIFNNHFSVGNNFVEIIRGQVGKSKFIKIINRPFFDCRLSEPNEDDIPETVFISKNFRNKSGWMLNKEQAVELPIYYGDPDMPWYTDEKQGTEHCVIHIKNEVPGYEYYGLPDNISSLPWQILEYKGARYNIDNFENNMVIGGVAFVNGDLSDDEVRKIGRDIIFTHTGDGKVGRWAILANPKIDVTKSGFQQFNTHQEGSFLELDDNTESKIVDSNNWDTALYGQSKTTGIGNGGNAYLTNIYNIKKETVIEPAQRLIKEDFLEPLFEICDKWRGTKWSEFDLGFKAVSPVSLIGDVDINKVLTKNEGRDIIGYPEMESEEIGKSIIEENKQNNKKNVSN